MHVIAAAHQLHFLPWLRYVHKALSADIFILLDDVQFVKGGWQHRNRLLGPNGPFLLTVPVRQRLGQRIDEVEIDNRRDWRSKHLASLRSSYGRAAHFKQIYPRLEAVYRDREWRTLSTFSLELLRVIWELVGIQSSPLRSSELSVPGRASERLAALCQRVSADRYLTGAHAAEHYLDVELLAHCGVKTLTQKWIAPRYPQVHERHGFATELSIVDMLMNVGPGCRELLLSAGRRPAAAS